MVVPKTAVPLSAVTIVLSSATISTSGGANVAVPVALARTTPVVLLPMMCALANVTVFVVPTVTVPVVASRMLFTVRAGLLAVGAESSALSVTVRHPEPRRTLPMLRLAKPHVR
jgi:hypothetical protein